MRDGSGEATPAAASDDDAARSLAVAVSEALRGGGFEAACSAAQEGLRRTRADALADARSAAWSIGRRHNWEAMRESGAKASSRMLRAQGAWEAAKAVADLSPPPPPAPEPPIALAPPGLRTSLGLARRALLRLMRGRPKADRAS